MQKCILLGIFYWHINLLIELYRFDTAEECEQTCRDDSSDGKEGKDGRDGDDKGDLVDEGELQVI